MPSAVLRCISIFCLLTIRVGICLGDPTSGSSSVESNAISCGDSGPLLWRWERGACFVGSHEVYLAIPNPRPEDRPIELELNVPEPLDLSELLGALEDIRPLDKPDLSADKPGNTDHATTRARPEILTNEDILVIGQPSQLVQPAEVLVLPENPLRAEAKPTIHPEVPSPPSPPSPIAKEEAGLGKPQAEDVSSGRPAESSPSQEPIVIGGMSGETKTAEPISVPSLSPESIPDKPDTSSTSTPLPNPSKAPSDKASSGDEPKPIQIGSDQALPLMNSSRATKDTSLDAPAKSPEKATRPKLRTITLDPDSTRDQEVPSPAELNSTPLSPSTADDDKKALGGTKPQAAPKTFVSRPSTTKLSDLQQSPPSSRGKTERMQRVDNCLAYYLSHLETTVERSPWSVMHAMLPFGVEGEILVGNQRVNAIQWLCYNGTCRGQKLFTPTSRYFRPNVGGGVQGHEGQFLAMLAQSQVSAEYPLMIGGKRFSIADLVKYEMATCKERSELTFKLIGLSYYVDTSQVWTTDRHSRWNIEKLVREELAQPINGAACGGTHRLMGLTFALKQRRAESRPIDGQFARADKFIQDFIEYTWKLQNTDGSFSTSWFEGRANEPNMERKVQTTGHILEWLAFTLPDEELHSPRFLKSLDFLLLQIWDNRQHKWPIGPRGHATRAIALYQQRIQGVQPGQRREVLADQIQSLRITR